jgi:hypothetical protein
MKQGERGEGQRSERGEPVHQKDERPVQLEREWTESGRMRERPAWPKRRG